MVVSRHIDDCTRQANILIFSTVPKIQQAEGTNPSIYSTWISPLFLQLGHISTKITEFVVDFDKSDLRLVSFQAAKHLDIIIFAHEGRTFTRHLGSGSENLCYLEIWMVGKGLFSTEPIFYWIFWYSSPFRFLHSVGSAKRTESLYDSYMTLKKNYISA